MYEVIAGPQEQWGQVQQENWEHPAQGPAEPNAEQQPEGKPGACPIIFKFMTPAYVSNTCALGSGIVWNPSCMILRFL